MSQTQQLGLVHQTTSMHAGGETVQLACHRVIPLDHVSSLPLAKNAMHSPSSNIMVCPPGSDPANFQLSMTVWGYLTGILS